jgi:hypothetical protein
MRLRYQCTLQRGRRRNFIGLTFVCWELQLLAADAAARSDRNLDVEGPRAGAAFANELQPPRCKVYVCYRHAVCPRRHDNEQWTPS